jgi:hypothetical protein
VTGRTAGCSQIRTWSAESVEQLVRILQVGGIEALGEPALDRREQVVCLGPPTLLGPQPGEAHRRAQFQRLRPLTLGGNDRPTQPCCRLGKFAGTCQDGPQRTVQLRLI